MKKFKKRNKADVNDKVIRELDERIISVSELLDKAEKELMDMEPDSLLWIGTGKQNKSGEEIYQNVPQYEMQVKIVDTLQKDLALLIERREQVVHPRIDPNSLPWYKTLNWTELIKTTGVCTAAIGQMYVMYKLQRDGYLFGRDTAKIQYPRP